MRMLFDWLDNRTGYRRLLHETLYENIPGGARWRFVTGSMLVFAFATQATTGIFLWMCYSPGSQNAWESVYYIQNEMQGGWLLRGVHHFMAQAMVVLLPVHMLQVIWDKAYRGPREFNYWSGLILMQIVLALSLTGYLLPWDQKGYWATKVATNLMSLAPGGEYMQKLVVGGSDYGHFTLTRFFGLHAGVLPALLVGFLVLHLTLFRRHGITAESSERRPDGYFWPGQVFKDGVACLVLLAVVLLACVHFDIGGVISGNLPEEHKGAHLAPPADAVEEYKAARPEWYFLFLFQLLKKFEKNEFLGAIVIPAVIMGYLFIMPFVAKIQLGRSRASIGHAFNVLVFLALFVGAGYLTGEALYYDDYDSYNTYDAEHAAKLSEKERVVYDRPFDAVKEYKEAVKLGEHEYHRIKELIQFYGIPKNGALQIANSDPEIMGPRLFRRHCASCHSHLDGEGHGIAGPVPPPAKGDEEPAAYGAPNLHRFASREWIEGLLDPKQIDLPHYFGATSHKEGEMSEFLDTAELDAETVENIAKALSAEADLIHQRKADAADQAAIDEGRTAIVDNCTSCHQFREEEGSEGYPALTGYGSAKWLREFIANPEHERFYPDSNDRMPAFYANPAEPTKNALTAMELDLIVRWLREDDKDLMLKLASTTAAVDPPAKKDGEAKEGDAKEGEAKEGEAKEGDAKEGDAKEGDAKEGDAKDGEAKDGEAKESEAK